MSLDDKASDEAAAATAKLENEAGDATDQRSDLDLILWDLAQASALNESAELAVAVQTRLNALLGLRDRGVKQAPFVVLTGATMPAILVEVGFLSNPSEASRLAEPEHQQALARAIAAGIEAFLTLVMNRRVFLIIVAAGCPWRCSPGFSRAGPPGRSPFRRSPRSTRCPPRPRHPNSGSCCSSAVRRHAPPRAAQRARCPGESTSESGVVVLEVLAGPTGNLQPVVPWPAELNVVFVDQQGTAFIDLTAPPEPLTGSHTELHARLRAGRLHHAQLPRVDCGSDSLRRTRSPDADRPPRSVATAGAQQTLYRLMKRPSESSTPASGASPSSAPCANDFPARTSSISATPPVCPMAPRSATTVQRYAVNAAAHLDGHEVKLLVVACNTASSYALGALESSASIPVVGVVEAGCRSRPRHRRRTHRCDRYRRHHPVRSLPAGPRPIVPPRSRSKRWPARFWFPSPRRGGAITRSPIRWRATYLDAVARLGSSDRHSRVHSLSPAPAVAPTGRRTRCPAGGLGARGGRDGRRRTLRSALIQKRRQGAVRIELTDASDRFLRITRAILGRDPEDLEVVDIDQA